MIFKWLERRRLGRQLEAELDSLTAQESRKFELCYNSLHPREQHLTKLMEKAISNFFFRVFVLAMVGSGITNVTQPIMEAAVARRDALTAWSLVIVLLAYLAVFTIIVTRDAAKAIGRIWASMKR